MRTTASNNEDSGGQTGWSIVNFSNRMQADEPVSRQPSRWGRNTPEKLRISVKGTVNPPAAPTGLSVTPGHSQLALSWTASAGSSLSYIVSYTSAPTSGNGAVTNDAAASGNDPSTAWVEFDSTDLTSATITGLTNNTAYRVRVSAFDGNAGVEGPYVFGTGTPKALVWSFAPSDYNKVEGDSVDITIQLVGGVAPTGGLSFTLTPLFGTDVAATTRSGRCDTNSGRAVRADLGTTLPTTLTVQAGKTEGKARFSILVDTVDDHNECFAFRAATTASGWRLRTGTEQWDVAHILIREKVPENPTGLTVAPGNAKLDLSWTAPTVGVVTGYDVHYTSSTSVAAGATASGSDPSTAWVDASHSGTTASQSITGLTNTTPYRVRVRATNSGGNSSWVHGSGTPSAVVKPVLTGLTLSSGGTSVPLDPAFAGTTESYTALVPLGTTSLSVTATWTESGLLVDATSDSLDGDTIYTSTTRISSSGGSVTVSLAPGADPTRLFLLVDRGAGTNRLREYLLTIKKVPAAPTALTVTADTAKLDLSWAAPSGTVTGYDVHYTSALATGNDAVANDAAVQTGAASAGWKAVSRSGVTTSQSITGLTNDTPYRVRVRATNANGGGAWVFGTGTPKAKTWSFQPDEYRLEPGSGSKVRINLSVPAPAGGLAFTLTRQLGTNVPTGLCAKAGHTKATAEDVGANPPTTLTVQAGEMTSGSARFHAADNGDDTASTQSTAGTQECFAVSASTAATGWTLATGGSAAAEMVIRGHFSRPSPSAASGLRLGARWCPTTPRRFRRARAR